MKAATPKIPAAEKVACMLVAAPGVAEVAAALTPEAAEEAMPDAVSLPTIFISTYPTRISPFNPCGSGHTSGSSNLRSLGRCTSAQGRGGNGGKRGGCGLDASLVTVLVCQVVGGGAVALHAASLAVGDWIDGVGNRGTLGTAVVVIVIA